METSNVIKSYQNNFKSPFGAYVYMLLNQHKPEFFIVSSNNDREEIKLESILLNADNSEDLILEITNIPEDYFVSIQEQNLENDLSKKTILKLIENLKYTSIDWSSNGAWEELSGFIKYNKYSEFIVDKSKLKEELQKQVEKFSLSSFSLNPNFHSKEFLESFEVGVTYMCEVLNISSKQVGLNTLNINYKTEVGDFTGYVNYDKKQNHGNSSVRNKMVINKAEVFAHEWMHFIESSLGFRNYSLTELMDYVSDDNLSSWFPNYNEVLRFKNTVNQNEKSYSIKSFSESLISASHFLKRYAINSNEFNLDIEKIASKLEKDFEVGKTKEECLENLEKSVSLLLKQPYPTRYLSFLKAQGELHIDKISEKILEKNQFMDFAKKSDKYLNSDSYTQSTIEVFARSFETYIYDRLKKNGINCYIVSSSYDSDFYPQVGMREKLNDLWGNMWPQIKKGIDIVMPVDN
jgi:hypothetical protein